MTEKDRLAGDAWEAIFEAQSLVFRELASSPIWKERSMKEYDVLYQLSRVGDEELCQRDLAMRLLIPQPSLSRLVDKLVGDGLVERRPDPADGRVMLLQLSQVGRSIQRRIGAAHAREISHAMTAHLSDDDLRTLRDVAGKLAAGTREALAAGGA